MLGAAGRTCRFAPVKGSFDSGVELTCTDQPLRRIPAEDDLALGRVRVFRDDRPVEEHRYHADTGTLTRSDITYGT